MIKNILAVAIVAALSACSSSSDSDNDNVQPDTGNVDTPTTGGGETTTPPGGETTTPTPLGGGDGPVTESKAGTYIGSLGFADGVYVIDNQNRLAGLAISAEGQAQSLFGQLDDADTFQGALTQYLHEQSRANPAAISFGSTAFQADDLGIDVTIVNGQTIESTAESETAVMLLGAAGSALMPATAEQLAGSWSGTNSFCNVDAAGEPIATECNTLTTQLTFAGTTVTGSTTFSNPDGSSTFEAPLDGGITDFGGASLLEFTWNSIAGYTGLVFFTTDNNGDIAFVGENAANPDNLTISGRLSRQ